MPPRSLQDLASVSIPFSPTNLQNYQQQKRKENEPTSCRPAGQPVLWGRVWVDGPGSGRLGGAEGGPGGPHPLPPPLHDHCGDHLQGQGMIFFAKRRFKMSLQNCLFNGTVSRAGLGLLMTKIGRSRPE